MPSEEELHDEPSGSRNDSDSPQRDCESDRATFVLDVLATPGRSILRVAVDTRKRAGTWREAATFPDLTTTGVQAIRTDDLADVFRWRCVGAEPASREHVHGVRLRGSTIWHADEETGA